MSRTLVLAWLLSACSIAQADDVPPRSLDARIKIELFAERPQIVTPTGVDVDHAGRVWAIESNTHFRPDGYQGHPSDRVLVLSDKDRDGRADQIVPFTDGLTHAMSVVVLPPWLEDETAGAKSSEGRSKTAANSVYVATRNEILLFEDDDGDLRADRKRRIVHLETKGTYPHDGLAGFALDALGWLYFGFGENLGAAYRIVGSDGTAYSGGGEGGNLYRCRLDGSQLTHWATGFWNPHASCFDAFGRLFTVDNDPDSRPPCRLLHIIPGGDYGYRFHFGRKGLYPLTSWNGEVPGTLPMVAGTGEAPSGVVAYESTGLPSEFIGSLLATSWGDHRIDRFRLKANGASFVSLAEPLIVGGENFRPVGIACAPDGSLFCTDWVLKDYTLHGQGRIWRISAVEAATGEPPVDVAAITSVRPISALAGMAASPRIDVRRAAARALSQTADGRRWLMDVLSDAKQPARSRIESLWALASVPLDVANLGFLSGQPNTPRIAGNSDELEPATIDLLGTPQFPFDATKTNFLRDPHVAERLWVPDSETALPTPTHRARRLLATMRLLPFEDALLSVSANDPFLLAAAVHRIKQSDISSTELTRLLREFTSRTDNSAPAWPQRLAIVLAARGKYPKAAELAELALQDPGLQIRRVAVQWVGEERLEQLRARVEDGLNDKRITSELFLATLAALEMLDGKNPVNFDKTPAGTYVLPLVHDARRPAAVRALALRMVSPADPALTAKLLGSLLVSDDATLRQEAIRTLQSSPLREAGELLRSAAADESEQTSLRAEAILGLASFAQSSKPGDPIGQLLRKLARSDNHELRTESLRSLRGLAATDGELRRQLETDLARVAGNSKITSAETEYAEQLAMALIGKDGQMPHVSSALAARRPTTGNDWLGASKASPGDPAAGRRVFYHSHSAGCYKCHTVNGRGGQVGPDLSAIGRTQDRDKLCQSLLEPSKEIAPQFVSWRLETRDGRVLSGLIVHENEGRTIIGNPEGQLSELRTADIEQRIPQQISLMPEKLVEKLTVQEFCDLVAFLETLK